ncbi:MAG: DUF4102 domain-containing protein [Candidatus Accumulibacter sp.]|uniref:Arm DNA-binding domain-containing protein n=1 Tax=Accumulibacter sp. TaxID=2053492 RepID=UPI001B1AD744|nr:Arm DNA-binding domain-containing protein [Accumulibacter sp.]MBO3712610.1 DUF4102 domain-containing protein [Accumulibacter sp.]
MNRERLTPDRIRRLTLPAGVAQSFLWDTDAPRLAVRVTAGAKAFIFEAKLNRQTVRVTIGDVRAWTLAAARDEARRLQTMIDQGIDPRQEKADRIAAAEAKRAEAEAKRIEAERIATPALEAWQKYIEARAPKWSQSHLADHATVSKEGGEHRTQGRRPGESDKTLPGILRPLLALPLEQIDADRVRVWLQDESAKRPTHTRLAFGLLRAFLNWCADRPEYRNQAHADACITRMARDELPKKIAKDDCLQREQLPAWFASVRQIQNPVIAAYLQTALLIGARREEVAGLQWEPSKRPQSRENPAFSFRIVKFGGFLNLKSDRLLVLQLTAATGAQASVAAAGFSEEECRAERACIATSGCMSHAACSHVMPKRSANIPATESTS